MFSWINEFHNTKAQSKLNEQDLVDIGYEIYSGRMKKSENKYKQMKRLENKLCGMKGCQCGAFNKLQDRGKEDV